MGRNDRKMLAPRTLNMFPKFELAPILMYFVMFAKMRRPSTTPSLRTSKFFSRRMMSADSFAISTAVSTDMPTSAAFSAGLSLIVAEESDHAALDMQGAHDPLLLRR